MMAWSKETKQMLMSDQEYQNLLKENNKTIPTYNTVEYGLGYDDAWKGNAPNPEYENDDRYMFGYDSAVQDRYDQYRY